MKKLLLALLCAALLPVSALLLTLPAAADTVTLAEGGDLATALNSVADGGTVELVGTVTVPTGFAWPSYEKSVTIAGGTLDLTAMGSTVKFNGNVTFAATTLTMTANATVYANGHTVTVGEDVTVTNAVTAIYGGGASGTTVASTNLTLLSGDYKTIYGGSNKGTVSGDTHLTVGGTVNTACDWTSHTGTYKVFGGGNGDTIGGDVHFTFTGSAKANYIYGGSNGSSAKITGDKHATMSGGSTMSFYGGNVGVDTGKTNYTVMSGGQLQQLLGGNSGANMTGDVYLNVLGGTVTRRIYGGCYNEAGASGLSLSWSSEHYVKGTITLTLDAAATITFTKDGYADHAIFARSRYESNHNEEAARLIYLGSSSYTKFKNLVGYQQVYSFGLSGVNKEDTGFGLYMKSLSAADETHTISYTASGATITEACSLCATAHSATATLARKDSAPLIYSGSALAPEMVINFSDGWKTLPLFTVDYVNNVNAGTATASITRGNVTAALDFTIEKATQAAPDGLSAVNETVKGRADGQISGLSTTMEWSTDGVTFSPVSDAHMPLSAGTYYVRLPETDNQKASPAVALTVDEGRLLSVTFVADGVTVDTRYVAWNGSVTDLPAIPTKTHYDQTAPVWDGSYTNLQANATVTAVYTPNTYTVTFMVDGKTYKTESVAFGDSLTPIAVPAKNGYNGKWNITDFATVTGDMTVEAIYTAKQYNVTFIVNDRSTVVKVNHGTRLGDIADRPTLPTKEGYTQTPPCWDKSDDTVITTSLYVRAVYTLNVYSVTFVADGETVATLTVNHGESVESIPAVPEKVGYTAAWNTANFNTVTGDMTVEAIYTLKQYSVTFVADGETVTTLTVNHGESVESIPTVPEKVGYTAAWNTANFDTVTGDMTVEAIYTPITPEPDPTPDDDPLPPEHDNNPPESGDPQPDQEGDVSDGANNAPLTPNGSTAEDEGSATVLIVILVVVVALGVTVTVIVILLKKKNKAAKKKDPAAPHPPHGG